MAAAPFSLGSGFPGQHSFSKAGRRGPHRGVPPSPPQTRAPAGPPAVREGPFGDVAGDLKPGRPQSFSGRRRLAALLCAGRPSPASGPPAGQGDQRNAAPAQAERPAVSLSKRHESGRASEKRGPRAGGARPGRPPGREAKGTPHPHGPNAPLCSGGKDAKAAVPLKSAAPGPAEHGRAARRADGPKERRVRGTSRAPRRFSAPAPRPKL